MIGSEEGGGWEVRRREDGDLYDWRRRCHDHREIQRLSGRRCCLAQEAAFGMVAGVHALDVHDTGERVASCLMEQQRVGDRNTETAGQEQDGEQGGANAARHERHNGNLRGRVSGHNRNARGKGLAGAAPGRRFNVYTVGRSVWRTVGLNEGRIDAIPYIKMGQ